MKGFVKRVSQKISKLSDDQVEQLIDAINEENDTLDSILESLSDGLVIVDEEWHLLQTNKAAERYLPFKTRPVEQRSENVPVWTLIDDSLISAFLQDCATNQKVNVSDEFSLAAPEDKVRFITVTVLPLVQKQKKENSDAYETHVVGSIITIDDITEKRTQEVLLHRMESLASLTNLAASVAHEIKNPLGAISIHIQLLQKAVKKAREGDGMLPDEKFMENYLAVINEEIDNLNKIVIDFLFAVRPVQAQMTLVDPDELVKKFASFFKAEFDSKNVAIKVSLCENCPRLMIDEKLFREVIVNIAQNALAAILVRFPAQPKEEPEELTGELNSGELVIESYVKNDKYFLTIADNGCGMDEKTASHIFEPYFTTKANGTGLGLTMVYKIIKEFSGDIDVKSVPGHGTVFTIMLPVPQTATKLLTDKTSEKTTAKNQNAKKMTATKQKGTEGKK
jgi:signal transduction histidine kinase